MNYKFSRVSQSRLATCDPRLALVANMAIKDSPYDFLITHGYRSIAIQMDLYKRGRELINGVWTVTDRKKVVTNCDGVNKKSNHNYNPSRAFDIAILIDGKVTWKEEYYKIVAGHIMSIADDLFDQGQIDCQIRWGGMFHNFDGPHYEIYES